MTVSILGCGWYGLALAKALVADGITVKGSTTSGEKLPLLEAENIRPFLVDLSAEQPSLNRDFFNCDLLIIAIPPGARSGRGGEYVPKLKRALTAIIKSGIKKVILISSTGVYADLNKEVNELTDPQPNTQAGNILLDAEQLFSNQAGFKTTIIRFGGLVGPARDPGRFFGGKKDLPNGLAPVNLIHLTDCIGITKAVIAQDLFGFVINACSPDRPEKQAFYTMAAAKAGLDLPEFLPELTEWKTVDSVIVGEKLIYRFQIDNWLNWLNTEA